MTPKELLIDALRRLCNSTTGGFRAVADTIGADEQTLYQILKGVKLPSGEPRGVGPQLQRKLTAHYPGWAAPATPPASTSAELADTPALEARKQYESPARGWPFKRIKPTDLQGLSDADLGYIEGQLMAALRDIGAGPSSKGQNRRAM